jgi:uncharacterized protein YciW
MTDDLWHTTALRLSGLTPEAPAAAAVVLRADVLRMTDRAEAAVLAPREPGAWSHDMRAALASRIARINGKGDLAEAYRARIAGPAAGAICDPDHTGRDAREATVLRFMDRVAARPRDVTADEVADLSAAGVADADIVRLCELNAFMAYQIGLIHGLALLAGAADE